MVEDNNTVPVDQGVRISRNEDLQVREMPTGIPGKDMPAAGEGRVPETPGGSGGAIPKSPPGRTSIIGTLKRLWMDILDLPDVSNDDDFFLSGGNSLTAIELLIRLQREYHVNLPPDTIYRYPTIHSQVMILQKKIITAKEYHTLIFPLREGGNLPPLFCIHPLGGWMDHYLKILSSIDNSRPIFGIRGRGLEPGEVLPRTVEDTAREQVEAIQTVQNNGPYHLLGFSNGGILAYELACQLQEKQEEVAFLGLIDVSAPSSDVRYFKTIVTTLFPGRMRKIPEFFESRLKGRPDSRVYPWIMKSVRAVSRRISYKSGSKALPDSVYDLHASVHFRDDTLAKYPAENRHNMMVQLNASRMYLPHTFRGDLVLFSTGQDPILHPGDDTRGWGSLITGRCEVIMVSGDHSNLFDEPYLGILNGKIKERLGTFR